MSNVKTNVYTSTRQVTLILETSIEYGRRILIGVAEYGRTHGHWRFMKGRSSGILPAREAVGLEGDGAIAHISTEAAARWAMSFGIPIINVSARLMNPPLPTIVSDDFLIGRLAAEHFIERGFQHFAYFGIDGYGFSIRRGDSFEQHVRQHPNSTFSRLDVVYDPDWSRDKEHQMLQEWLMSLPKPLAIFCCNDPKGLQVCEICRSIGLLVPEQVAVLGVDNDTIFCEFCDPPLSSIDLNLHQIGFRAAQWLDHLMQGSDYPTPPPVAPIGVVTRQSTDVFSIEDRDVASAIKYIRANAHRSIQVEDVLREVPINRRALERRFKRAIGRSPAAELRRQRIEIAKQLLAGTDHSMADIARRAGFQYPQHMAVAFRQLTGLTPSEYRDQFQKK
ncbi:MAG: XylR family transcriptional regulator [Phycisphaerae bacterium]|nr:MAG: XylR family transcriptional regulator [Phycisphaerae bacterium]